jgi:hypothetical protein
MGRNVGLAREHREIPRIRYGLCSALFFGDLCGLLTSRGVDDAEIQ